jgi:hypothetical protein
MKKVFILSLVAVALLAGCNDTKTVKMDSPEAVELVALTLEKNVPLNLYKVLSVHWMESGELNNKLGSMSIEMVNVAGSLYKQDIKLSGEEAGPGEVNAVDDGRIYDYSAISSLSLADFDATRMLSYFEQAKTHIPETMQFRALSDIKMKISPETGKVTTHFIINVIDKDVKVSKKKPILMYYSLFFIITPEGLLERVE